MYDIRLMAKMRAMSEFKFFPLYQWRHNFLLNH